MDNKQLDTLPIMNWNKQKSKRLSMDFRNCMISLGYNFSPKLKSKQKEVAFLCTLGNFLEAIEWVWCESTIVGKAVRNASRCNLVWLASAVNHASYWSCAMPPIIWLTWQAVQYQIGWRLFQTERSQKSFEHIQGKAFHTKPFARAGSFSPKTENEAKFRSHRKLYPHFYAHLQLNLKMFVGEDLGVFRCFFPISSSAQPWGEEGVNHLRNL